MNTFFYIISISLQVSGSLLLMFFSLSTSRAKVIKKFINKDIVTKTGSELIYNEEEFKETFRTIYLNRCSFGFIALGSIFSILGDADYCNNWIIFIGIILFTFILSALAYLLVGILIKHLKKVNDKLSSKELEENNIKPSVEFATNKDIDKLFKNLDD